LALDFLDVEPALPTSRNDGRSNHTFPHPAVDRLARYPKLARHFRAGDKTRGTRHDLKLRTSDQTVLPNVTVELNESNESVVRDESNVYFGMVMSSDDRALAVLLRATQWELDEAAFELGGGRYTREQRHVLAERLTALATRLRTGEAEPVAIEATADRT
jgi:hypothetical protein